MKIGELHQKLKDIERLEKELENVKNINPDSQRIPRIEKMIEEINEEVIEVIK